MTAANPRQHPLTVRVATPEHPSGAPFSVDDMTRVYFTRESTGATFVIALRPSGIVYGHHLLTLPTPAPPGNKVTLAQVQMQFPHLAHLVPTALILLYPDNSNAILAYRTAALSARHPPSAVDPSSDYFVVENQRRIQRNKRLGADIAQWIADCRENGGADMSDLIDVLTDSPLDQTQASSIYEAGCRAAGVIHYRYNEPHLCDCGHWEHPDDRHTLYNGDTWCGSCTDAGAVYVESRGAYYPRDDVYHWDRDDEYHLDPEPEYDYSDGDPDRRMEYSTDVMQFLTKDHTFATTHDGEFHMGLEVEMVVPSSHDTFVYQTRQALDDDYVVFKSDGSLPEDGIEMVCAPRALKEHLDKLTTFAPPAGSTAWDNGKCGTHVHIDSRAFTALTLGKFQMFINATDNDAFIRKIAGRHPHQDHQAQSYCAALDQSILVNPAKAAKGDRERYRMVNLQRLSCNEAKRLASNENYGADHASTVELRIFRATLKKERLLAQVEFAHAAVMFCRQSSWRELNGKAFLKWLKGEQHAYPSLAAWYGVRDVRPRPNTVTAVEHTEECDPQMALA